MITPTTKLGHSLLRSQRYNSLVIVDVLQSRVGVVVIDGGDLI